MGDMGTNQVRDVSHWLFINLEVGAIICQPSYSYVSLSSVLR